MKLTKLFPLVAGTLLISSVPTFAVSDAVLAFNPQDYLREKIEERLRLDPGLTLSPAFPIQTIGYGVGTTIVYYPGSTTAISNAPIIGNGGSITISNAPTIGPGGTITIFLSSDVHSILLNGVITTVTGGSIAVTPGSTISFINGSAPPSRGLAAANSPVVPSVQHPDLILDAPFLITFPSIAPDPVTSQLKYLYFGNPQFYPTARFQLQDTSHGPEIAFRETVFEHYFEVTHRRTGVVLTRNQQAVAHALDRSSPDPRQADLVVALLDQFDRFLPAEFNAIAPEELTATFETALASADLHLQNISDRLETLRSADPQTPARPGTEIDPKDGKSFTAPAPARLENLLRFWSSGSGAFLNVGDDPSARGYDLKTGAISLGADLRFSPSIVVGIAGSYAHTEVDLSERGNLKVDGERLALYASYAHHGAYLDGAIGGGYNDFKTHRAALAGYANGRSGGGEFDSLLRGGYDLQSGRLLFGPTASASYNLAGLHHFQENGSLAPLAIRSNSEDRLRSRIGGHAGFEFQIGDIQLRPEVRAEWQHDYLADRREVAAGFANGAGPDFSVQGPELGRDAAVLSLSLTAQWTSSLTTFVSYEAELGRENYQRQTLNLGLEKTF